VASRGAAAASELHVAQAARELLAHGGDAVDAVAAGVLVAAAETPSVLLGPVQLLVGGAGAGLRAIDGRVRQPGSGVPRPRGVAGGGPVPAAALVGVPTLPATIALVQSTLGRLTLRRVAGAAIERARARSAERARVIEAFARRGAAVMADDAIAGELTALAGRSAGGVLTRVDLDGVRPAIVACDERSLDPAGVLTAPWRGAAADASCTHVVAAADARGLVVVACYEAPIEGLAVPSLGLVAPPFASPVLRGTPRVRPGQPCGAAAPIALHTAAGVADVGVGVAACADAEASLDGLLRALASGATVAEALAALPGGRAVAVTFEPRAARVVASA